LLQADETYSESSTGQQLLQDVVDEPGILEVTTEDAALLDESLTAFSELGMRTLMERVLSQQEILKA